MNWLTFGHVLALAHCLCVDVTPKTTFSTNVLSTVSFLRVCALLASHHSAHMYTLSGQILWVQLRGENLSSPSVERTPRVLLPWAKPLSFYPAAIDGRCRRSCLSFVFLSEHKREVGGRGKRIYREQEESKDKREQLVPGQTSTVTLQRTATVLPLLLFTWIHARLDTSDVRRQWVRQGYSKASQPPQGWLSAVWWSESHVSYHYSRQYK